MGWLRPRSELQCRRRWRSGALLIGMLVACASGWSHGNLHDLIEQVTEQIREDGSRVDLLLLRAKYYRLHGNFPAALNDLARAEALEPDSANVHCQRARVYLDQGRYQDCITSIASCLKLQPDFGGAFRVRAQAYRKMGRFDRAEQDFSRAIRARPEPDVYRARGECLLVLGNLDEAVRNYEDGLKRLGNPISLLAYLVDALVAARRHEEALARVDALLKRHPQLDAWRMRRAEILEKAGRPKEAAAEYRRLVKRIDERPPRIRARTTLRNLRRQASAAASRLHEAASQPASAPVTSNVKD